MEELAVLFTIFTVYSASIEQKTSWLLNMLASIAYSFVFWQQHLYANFGLQIFYVLISLLGYFVWYDSKKQFFIDTRNMQYYYNRWIIIFSFLYLIVTLCEGEMQMLDCILTSGSIIATWMLIKKDTRSWLLWFYLNVFYVFLFLIDLLIFSTFLYSILAIFSL